MLLDKKLEAKLRDHYDYFPENLKETALSEHVGGMSQFNWRQLKKHWFRTRPEVKSVPIFDKRYELEDRYHITRMNKVVRRYTTPKEFVVWAGLKFDPSQYQEEPGEPFLMTLPYFKCTSIDFETAKGFSSYNSKQYYHPRFGARWSNTGEPVDKYWERRYRAAEYSFYKKHPDVYETKGYVRYYYHVAKIRIPKGAHGAYIAHQCRFEGEKEFVLPRNCVLKFKPKPRERHLYGENAPGRYWLWQAEMVFDGVKAVKCKGK